MKQIYRYVLLVIGCVALGLGLASCESDPVAPSMRGTIVGFAGLRDEAGARLRDQSGITVRIKGSDYLGVTDTAGVWKLNDVVAGIYDLELSKPGYATNYVRAYQFVGGGTAYITSGVDLIRSYRDTLRDARITFKPDIEIRYRDTLIETDTGWVNPLDTLLIPNRIIELAGDVTFERDTQRSATIYVQPYYTDLSVVPSTNYPVGVVHKGSNMIEFNIQQLLQRSYPRGEPVEVVFTTRQNNTYYFEPSTRLRVVTDPHDLLRVVLTIPEE